ncbi:amino acid permease 2 [Cordyceps militaris]|uniref:Amino acid permease 2 n=1 Tax=Cordyceps militaris TaxID=73501 RepID=A0A2H4SDU5_CORMI|nr:amino acid permease 2 [Cordyceps militaris]
MPSQPTGTLPKEPERPPSPSQPSGANRGLCNQVEKEKGIVSSAKSISRTSVCNFPSLQHRHSYHHITQAQTRPTPSLSMAATTTDFHANKDAAIMELTTPRSFSGAQDDTDSIYCTTGADNRDMERMGRKQEFIRQYRVFSMISFVSIATSAWCLGAFEVTPALINGGIPSMIFSNVWCFAGYLPIILSMAEMSSMAPIAGAQYHWVSEFAPESCQQLLSYLTGWSSTMAWQAGNALGLFLVGTLIQATITLNNDDYVAKTWHGSLFVIAVSCTTVLANIFGSRIIPHTQNAIFALSLLAFVAFLVPIWVNAPMADSKDVWTNWVDRGNWGSLGLSVMVGQLPAMAAFQGIDTAAHMSEEVRQASVSVPRVMIAVLCFNFIETLLVVVTLGYHMPSVQDALDDVSTYPVVHVLMKSMSLPWVTVLLVIICLLLTLGNVSYLAAVSRDLFAFARDDGLPFSKWLSKVDYERKIPTNAYIFSGTLSSLLSLVYIGSPVAFYAITSLGAVAVLQCYCLSIGCILWRRVCQPDTIPAARFSLGRWGIPVNCAAVLFSAWSFFWSFWPQTNHPSASGFNWASPIFSCVLIGALIYYYIIGRKRYLGPVALVEGRKEHLS